MKTIPSRSSTRNERLEGLRTSLPGDDCAKKAVLAYDAIDFL